VLSAALVHDLQLTEVEVGAFWTFVQRSAGRLKNGPRTAHPGVGARWGCVSVDRPTCFVVAWASGATEEQAAPPVVA
jgi:hypothetical protein